MASSPSAEDMVSSQISSPPASMQTFKLYETHSYFYMVGREKSKTMWRVLKIDRMDPSELNINEDSTLYTEGECSDLLRRIHEGNRVTGGLKFVTFCYGIIGFIKFLGPYYMLLITERKKIGSICGHKVYSVMKSEMIPLPNSGIQRSIHNLRDENRYKRLLSAVDLTKDFYFSYSYHVMCSLQKNLSDNETTHGLHEKMFVWNEFLTREIRTRLQNTLWTVALVYGFFKQGTFSFAGRELKLTLMARRSRDNAGTRYLKRGVTETGRVANDVETEQIVSEDVPDGDPMLISSVVQNRGSIPLFWSQETSRLNLKPDIVLSKKDQNYEATRLHFGNLVSRYGNPIIILNLIKTQEKKPRESILRSEFANAIDSINKDLPEDNRLRFLHWDLHKNFRSKSADVLVILGKVASRALTLTGFFYCRVSPALKPEGFTNWPSSKNISAPPNHCDNETKDNNDLETNISGCSSLPNGGCSTKPLLLQRGVLRTNCIDCLDRTNVAQYAYGLAALGQQLHALGVIDNPEIDLDTPLAYKLMEFYEAKGDTLAYQYGGSAAHNKVFSVRRGQWRAAIQSQEFFRTLQRYYSNAYMDAEKQDAINLFLGDFQPQQGKPAVWELRSNSLHGGLNGTNRAEDGRSFMKRCLSDGNILHQASSSVSAMNFELKKHSDKVFPDHLPAGSNVISESSPDISTSESDVTLSRCTTPSMPPQQLFGDVQRDQCHDGEPNYFSGYRDVFTYSNFVDVERLSSAGSLFEEETYDRSSILANSTAEIVTNGLTGEAASTTFEYGSSSMEVTERRESEVLYDNAQQSHHVVEEFSDSFAVWVNNGETICH